MLGMTSQHLYNDKNNKIQVSYNEKIIYTRSKADRTPVQHDTMRRGLPLPSSPCDGRSVFRA